MLRTTLWPSRVNHIWSSSSCFWPEIQTKLQSGHMSTSQLWTPPEVHLNTFTESPKQKQAVLADTCNTARRTTRLKRSFTVLQPGRRPCGSSWTSQYDGFQTLIYFDNLPFFYHLLPLGVPTDHLQACSQQPSACPSLLTTWEFKLKLELEPASLINYLKPSEAHWFDCFGLVSASGLENSHAEKNTGSCWSDSAALDLSQRPLQAGGWTSPPQSGNGKNGGTEQKSGRCPQRMKKSQKVEESRRRWGGEKRRWGWGRGETGRRREKGEAQGGTPGGQWSGCDSAGRWEGGTMWTGHVLPVEPSSALQPTSESWKCSGRGLRSSVAGASHSELQDKESVELQMRLLFWKPK